MPPSERLVAAARAEAAAEAGYAPSIHAQPWRWRVLPDWLELYADRSRHPAATDPQGQLVTLACGAALHRAQWSWRRRALRHASTGSPIRLRRTSSPRGPDGPATRAPPDSASAARCAAFDGGRKRGRLL
jgi:hypothetical protein